MKKNLLILFVSVLLLTLVSCGKKVEKSDQGVTKTPAPTELKDSVVIVTVGVDSMNVLEILKANHDVQEVSSAMGTFVKGIDGVENNMHTFWFFEVNGEMASKAADLIPTTPSDTIIWYFRQPGSESSTDASEPSADGSGQSGD